MSNIRGVFIGGTGRSGTTILAKTLALNKVIYSLPYESRFLTDPDGLNSLHKSISLEWSFFQGDYSIDRFLGLMSSLKTKYRNTYPNFGLEDYVSDYDIWISDYIKNLGVLKIKSGWAARTNLFQKLILLNLGKNSFTEFFLKDSYYVPPISEALFFQATQDFIQDYYSKLKLEDTCEIVVDHTPSNILYSNFINSINPEYKIIHIYRNPLDIACSFSEKNWGSEDIFFNTKWIFDTLKSWDLQKDTLPEHTYLEVKFENLIYNTEDVLKNICNFLEVDFDINMLKMDLAKHNIGRWKSHLSKETIDKVLSENHLKLNELGYEI